MKKILTIALWAVFAGLMIQPVFAEEEIEGLHEKLSSLFLENYFMQEGL